MTDDPSSPSVERDGRLYVQGAGAPLERDPARTIYFDALDLQLHRFFESVQGKTISRIRFAGKVVLKKDSIGIAGEKDTTRELSFSCFPCDPDEPDYEWNIMFGFLETDWQIGTKDDWFCQCYIPQAIFDELISTYKDGRANALKVGCNANMWASESVSYVPLASKIHWKLAPQKYSPDMGIGKISHFSWQVQSKKAALPETSAPVNEPPAALVNDSIQPQMRDSPPSKLIQRLGYVLGWIFNIAAGLFLALAIYLQFFARTISVPFPYVPYAFTEPYLNQTLPEIVVGVLALGLYLTGGALRYVLVGPRRSQ